jgi:TPR repeat protein
MSIARTHSALLFLIMFGTFISSVQNSRAQPLGAASDLNGVWQQDPKPSVHDEKALLRIVVAEISREVVGINAQPQPYLPLGYPSFKGTLTQMESSKVDVQGFTQRGLLKWFPGTMNVRQPDHFEIQIPGSQISFTRISKSPPGSAPCDIRNPSHLSGPEAHARAWLYTHLNDYRAAACWARIGAEQGFSESELWYATDLLLGRGVAKNVSQGVSWAQKSAMQGSFGGAKDLASIFQSGEGLPPSDQRSRYWDARAQLIDPEFVHRDDFLPIPKWASDTSGLCTASSESGANEDTAFRAARVAFQARVFEAAACWFQISERLGSTKAKVYLGILYMYGFGVPKNPATGFEYMQKAANANEPFAMMYLANFYRFGMGTKADHNAGSALVAKVMRMSDGFDAFSKVEGTALSPQERSSLLVKGLSSASDESTCNSLNALNQSGPNPLYRGQVRDCSQTQDWFLGALNRPGHNTVQRPEEIMPEGFDFVVPGNITVLKNAAKSGLTR